MTKRYVERESLHSRRTTCGRRDSGGDRSAVNFSDRWQRRRPGTDVELLAEENRSWQPRWMGMGRGVRIAISLPVESFFDRTFFSPLTIPRNSRQPKVTRPGRRLLRCTLTLTMCVYPQRIEAAEYFIALAASGEMTGLHVLHLLFSLSPS